MGVVSNSIKHALNAFQREEQTPRQKPAYGSYSSRGGAGPHRTRTSVSNERSIIASVYTTISVDASDVELRHSMVDKEGGYVSTVKDGLQYCLSQEPNIDQGARAFRRDAVQIMLDKGVVAVAPIDTVGNPIIGDSYDINTMRAGEIVEFHPDEVTMRLYDDRFGIFKDITMPKRIVAIVENPFSQVMNEPNSTLQRLIRKLNLLDVVDDKNTSGKLQMIIQLPHVVRTPKQRAEATERIDNIEFQLNTGKHGVTYIDAQETVTQLNRPIESNFLEQVDRLIKLLFSQLGLTEEIMNGTADESAMTNYMARTIEPIIDAFAEEYHRKFLSKTARTQGHAIQYFRDPFKLIPITRLAEIADVLSRNEIASPNDVRKAIGWIPSQDPEAEKLKNSNMPEKVPQEVGAGGQPLAIEAPRYVSKQMEADAKEAELNAQVAELGIS